MSIRYEPTCPACRAGDTATFYKTCQGCQTRRAEAMKAFLAGDGRTAAPLPASSINKPKELS